MGIAIEVVVSRNGDGVSLRRAFPKRCANFGNEMKTSPTPAQPNSFALHPKKYPLNSPP